MTTDSKSAAAVAGPVLSDGLGPLPPCTRVVEYNTAKGYSFDAYTAEQMLSYAAAAVAAERERCVRYANDLRRRLTGTTAKALASECAVQVASGA